MTHSNHCFISLKLNTLYFGVISICFNLKSVLLILNNFQEHPGSRKRHYSQDSEEYINHENSKPTHFVKEETCSEEVKTLSKSKPYNTFISELKNVSPQEVKIKDNITPYSDHLPKKKKKMKSQEVLPMNVGRPNNNKIFEKRVFNDTVKNKNPSSAHVSYDYSQVDYNQFHSQKQNSLTPKHSQDSKFKQKVRLFGIHLCIFIKYEAYPETKDTKLGII